MDDLLDIRMVDINEPISTIIGEIRINQHYLLFKKKDAPKHGLVPIMDTPVQKMHNLHEFGEYEVLSLLGKGSFGFVWKVKQLDTGNIFALKIIPKESIIQHDDVDHVNLERKILKTLGNGHNPSIVTIYHTLQDEHNVYFIMEVCFMMF